VLKIMKRPILVFVLYSVLALSVGVGCEENSGKQPAPSKPLNGEHPFFEGDGGTGAEKLTSTERDARFQAEFSAATEECARHERAAMSAEEARDLVTAEREYEEAIRTAVGAAKGSTVILSLAPRRLAMMYLLQGRWAEALATARPQLGEGIVGPRDVRNNDIRNILSIAHYRLGDVENGDRYAPREAVDCGVWFTYDRQTHESDERPNKPVLDSPRKREAAAWHAIAVHASFRGTDHLALEFSEKAARMFPDEPAFSYVYARALRENGYATGYLEELERTFRNGRGHFTNDKDYDLQQARTWIETYPQLDRGRRP